MELSLEQAHHARHVLRLAEGTTVELFDDAGRVARGTLGYASATGGRGEAIATVSLLGPIAEPGAGTTGGLVVASAVPKGDRADWLVEKLSELGAAEWVPLITARSVVVPQAGGGGSNKVQRWRRLAVESAKQSRRPGVMRVGEAVAVEALIRDGGDGGERIVLSPDADAPSLAELARHATPGAAVTLLVGPEGGWTDPELSTFSAAGVSRARLTVDTVLRIETAAVAAAAVWLCAAATPVASPAEAHSDDSQS